MSYFCKGGHDSSHVQLRLPKFVFNCRIVAASGQGVMVILWSVWCVLLYALLAYLKKSMIQVYPGPCARQTQRRICDTLQHFFMCRVSSLGTWIMPNVCSLAPPKKYQLRAPLSPLQTAWTSFDPSLYSGGSSSAGPAHVEIATARSFILNRGIVTDTMSATPWSQDGMQCIPLHQGCGACWRWPTAI